MPLSRVVDEIQGEIYKKGIYISKHCEEHFKTLNAKFDLDRNDQDKTIYRKIEEHFNVEYDKYLKTTPISKEKQAELGICFTVQMTQKGTLIIWIKKRFKDVETFIEHYYRVFDFLEYEEHGRLLDLFYIQAESRKAFDYIHLTNKIGPKPTIDKYWKGAHVKVQYCTLKTGKKVINAKIDYSDPHEPELEIEGPEAESKNLRDILIKPAETLPTINNIGKWSLDARNNTKDLKFQNEKLFDQVGSNGQVLQLMQKNAENYHLESLSTISEIDARIFNIDIKTDIQHLDLKGKLEYLKKQFPQLKEALLETYSNQSLEHSRIRESLVNLIVQILNLDTNLQGNLTQIDNSIQQVFLDTSATIHDAKDEIIKTVNKTINERFDSLEDYLQEEFESVKFRVKNSLYLILRKIDKLPGLTMDDLQEKMRLPRTTLLYHLNKLKDKGLLETENIKTGRRGRPPKLYKFTKKMKEILSELEKRGKKKSEKLG